MQLAKSSTSESLPMPWVERLFARLLGFYGNKLAEQWRSTDLATVKALWAEELAGYSAAELGRGIDGCRTRDWPPTLPEFLKLCRPPMNPTMLWYEAQHAAKAREAGEVGEWSDPWVFHAYREMAHEVRSGEFAKHGDRWRAELERAKAKWDRGEFPAEVPAPVKELPAPAPLSREASAARAAELGVRVGHAAVDHKAWARVILQRAASGDRLPITHVDMARRALEQEGAPHD